VIRVGHWASSFHPKVLTVPLGLSNAFVRAVSATSASGTPGFKPAGTRRYRWSFLGQLRSKPTRWAMRKAFASIPDGYVFETFRWNDPRRLTNVQYREMLSDSVFSLCPRGWSVRGHETIDSFRAYESAEAGAIPVVDSAYYADAYGAPFLIVREDWTDAPALVTELWADAEALHARQTACHAWWTRYRTRCQDAVVAHIAAFTPGHRVPQPPAS
jgi:hypothetical protein